MSKIGVSIRIDVTKIDKARLYQGAKGTYLDITGFIELDQADQYGQNGFVSQSTTKEERDAGVKLPILGNTKVFYKENNGQAPQGYHQPAPQAAPSPPPQQYAPQSPQQHQHQPQQQAGQSIDEDIPF